MGLREIKKSKLKQAVQRETLRLFEEQGYEKTTVEQIAAAAEISITTFYRYFSSKEDVILVGAYETPGADGPTLAVLMAARPADEPAIESLRALLRERVTSGVLERHRDELLARLRLIHGIPELRAMHAARLQEGIGPLARLIAERSKTHDPASYELRTLAAMVSGALAETLRYWTDHDGEPDLAGLIDRTLERIAPLFPQ